MTKKIELNILLFTLIEAITVLFFFKEGILNTLLGLLIGIILVIHLRKVKTNTIISSIIFIISLFLFYTTTIKTSEFISFNILKNYPLIIITLCFILTSIYLSSKGYHTYIKTLEIIFYLFLFVKIVSLILVAPYINIHNITFNTSINLHLLSISFSLLYFFFSIKYLTQDNISIKISFLSLGNALITKIITLSIIGQTLFNIYQYPYISILKKIKYFNIFERMDGILSFEYLICFLFLNSFFLLIIFKTTKKIVAYLKYLMKNK